MQTLSESAIARAASQGHDVAWIFSIRWPDGWVHYAHRPIRLDSAGVAPLLLDPGRLHTESAGDWDRTRGWVRATLAVSLLSDGGASPALRERLAATAPEGLEAAWGFVLLDASGAASLDDRVTLFFGHIERVVLRRGFAEIECLDWLSARGRRTFDETIAPDLPPWVFGSIDALRLKPWRTGLPIAAAREIFIEDSRIWLQSVEGLPASGWAQIGDERFYYAAIDSTEGTLGTLSEPLVRSDPAWHRVGAAGRTIPDGWFEFLAAGHPCRAIDRVCGDGIPVDEADYAVTDEDYLGRLLQKVAIAQWPTAVEYESLPRTVTYCTRDTPGVWALLATSTADDAELAIDGNPEATGARLRAGAGRLDATWRGPTSSGLRRHGLLLGARLIARVAASGPWEAGAELRLSFRRGEVEVSRVLAHPRPDLAEGGFGPLDFILDLSSTLEQSGGWDLLDFADGGYFDFGVELDTVSDPVVFTVSDLALELTWHPRRRVDMARRITARVEGMHDGGMVLDNPADIARLLLTADAGFALSPEHIDEASFAHAAAALDALGYRFSNVIDEPRACAAILSRLLFESRCRLVASGQSLCLRLEEGNSALAEPDFAFDSGNLLRAGILAVERDPDRAFLQTVHLHHGRDFSGSEALSWRRSCHRNARPAFAPDSLTGATLVDRLEWHNAPSDVAVVDLAAILLARHGRRYGRIALTAPLHAAALEPRDRVSLADPWFPLALEEGHVERLEIAEPGRVTIHAAFPPQGVICWRYDDTTFLRRTGDGSAVEFRIEGVFVAALHADGALLLGGELREGISLSAGPTEPIAFDPISERLLFSAGTAGAYQPVFAIDGAGNFFLTGELFEDVPRDDLALATCFEATPAHFALRVSDTHPALVFDTALAALQLRGRLAEKIRLY